MIFNLLPYIPFYNYKRIWINKKLNKLKLKYGDKFIKDSQGDDIGWNVIKYYLIFAYDFTFFNEPIYSEGLRMHPLELLLLLNTKH